MAALLTWLALAVSAYHEPFARSTVKAACKTCSRRNLVGSLLPGLSAAAVLTASLPETAMAQMTAAPLISWAAEVETIVDGTSCFFVASRPDGIGHDLLPVGPSVALKALSHKVSSTTGRALFIGEHHDCAEDHALQAALITKLRQSHDPTLPLAVGLEAFQARFQPQLDAFCRGELSLKQLREATEWDTRWVWPFEPYVPVLNAAREAGAKLLALNVNAEDIANVQVGGFPALGPKLQDYIRNASGFAGFSTTTAFKEYVDYTIRPSYEFHKQVRKALRIARALPPLPIRCYCTAGLSQAAPPAAVSNTRTCLQPSARRTVQLGLLRKDKMGGLLDADISFRNFLSSRMLTDESMGSRTAAWLKAHPGGLAVSLVGNDHIKFGCGAAARCGRELGGVEYVRTVMVNPRNAESEPKNSYSGPRLPLSVLSLRYSAIDGDSGNPIFNAGPQDKHEASVMAQAREGQGVMPISDFLWFTQILTANDVRRIGTA